MDEITYPDVVAFAALAAAILILAAWWIGMWMLAAWSERRAARLRRNIGANLVDNAGETRQAMGQKGGKA